MGGGVQFWNIINRVGYSEPILSTTALGIWQDGSEAGREKQTKNKEDSLR